MEHIFESTKNTRPILENSLKFIRSDVPAKISEEEKLWLLGKNIVTVVDLRTEEERLGKKCPLYNDRRFNYFTFPITGGGAIPQSVDEVSKSYISMADEKFNEIIEFMLSCDSNILYFCNAGKDRTGVVTAALLLRLGFDAEYIVRDYMKSKDNLMDTLISFAKSNLEIDIQVITPNERYIREFIDSYSINN